jgi:hypothetical protein
MSKLPLPSWICSLALPNRHVEIVPSDVIDKNPSMSFCHFERAANAMQTGFRFEMQLSMDMHLEHIS